MGQGMNANQIVNMIIRTVLRRLINRGVNSGFDRASRRMEGGFGQPGAGQGQTRKQLREDRRAVRMARRNTRL